MANHSPTFGKDLVFWIDTAGTTSGSTEVNISRWVMSIDGLPGDREKADITCGGGAAGHEYVYGLYSADITLNCLYDLTTTRGAVGSTAPAWTVFANATTGDTHSRSFSFFPCGTGAGYPEIGGELRIKGVELPIGSPNDALTFKVSAVLDSTIAIGVSS